MSPAIFEFAGSVLALLLTGLAIKLMDDALDNPPAPGEREGSRRAVLPYALLFLAGGAALNTGMAVSLFFAAYAFGMAHDAGDKMPSGLYGWQESLLVAILGTALFGWAEMISSLLIIACTQVVDDIRDRREDCRSGQKNLALRFGSGEAGLLAAILFLAAMRIAFAKAVLTLLGSLAIAAVFGRITRNETERWVDYDF